MSTVQLFEAYEEHKNDPRRMVSVDTEDGGCSESCEVYDTVVVPEWLR
jgi:hypothetical protein